MSATALTAGRESESSRDAGPAEEYVGPIPRFPRERYIREVRRLSVVRGWRTTATIALQWLVILGSGTAAVWIDHWAAWLLAALVIAGRQQALGVLMHDGAHFALYRNHALNDVVSDLCLAFPLGLSTTLYRSTHLLHHRHTNTDEDPDVRLLAKDPDFAWPKTRWAAASMIVRSLLALNAGTGYYAFAQWNPAMHLFTPLSPAFPLRARLLWVASTAAVLTLVLGTGIWWPALWMWALPTLTLVNFFSRVRTISEHLGTERTHELNCSRTILANPLERAFFAPCGINYHIEHHVFPSVPWHRVAELHRLLMQDPEYRQHAHVTRGYLGVLRELTTDGMRDRRAAGIAP